MTVESVKALVAVWNASALARRMYERVSTQLMLTYSEDGQCNSSGAGFVFKSSGKEHTIGTGLLHPGASYQFVYVDHLQMGS